MKLMSVYNLYKMIDLTKIENEIDTLFENETKNSLTKWLFNKRYGNLTTLLGNGTFVSLRSESKSIFSNQNEANYNSKNKKDYICNPINRKAA